MAVALSSKLRVVAFKLDVTLLQQLDAFAVTVGKTRSDIIREAIIMYLERVKNDAK